ncbi:MAG: hypothetical protein NC336_07785 [Clostridium sp.]|nr:hypothetical protein [Clostridium sp.]
MKKAMCCIALLVVLLLSVSARTERIYAPAEGYKAPELTLADGAFSLSDCRGKFVLVDFWSSTDAASRIGARRLDYGTRALEGEHFRRVSVNFDTSESLFLAVAGQDGLDTEAQFYADATQQSEIASRWHLNSGFRSFLIDREGRIVAVNPSIETLRTLVVSQR